MSVRVRPFTRIWISAMCLFFLSAAGLAAQEVVLHSTDVTTIKGNWARTTTILSVSPAGFSCLITRSPSLFL